LLIRHYKSEIRGLTVALVGDVLHSGLARSEIHALTTLGAPEIRVIGPRTLLPDGLAQLGAQVFHEMDPGLRGADVIIVLGLPHGRFSDACLPSGREYFNSYGLTPERLALAASDALVLYAGRLKGCLEIERSVADSMHAVTLSQQTFGMAMRMAVMSVVAGAHGG
jgi:aspartate carbamoyltransferase catalytic subunit